MCAACEKAKKRTRTEGVWAGKLRRVEWKAKEAEKDDEPETKKHPDTRPSWYPSVVEGDIQA